MFPIQTTGFVFKHLSQTYSKNRTLGSGLWVVRQTPSIHEDVLQQLGKHKRGINLQKGDNEFEITKLK